MVTRILSIAFCSSCLLATLLAQVQGQETPQPAQGSRPTQVKRLYIEERIKTTTGGSVHCDTVGNCYSHHGSQSTDVSLEVTREVMKKCPSVLAVTDNHDAADYDLRLSPGSSTLYKQNGDVAYISPTRYKISNIAKDVCEFVASHP
jgi:hypothetical protein